MAFLFVFYNTKRGTGERENTPAARFGREVTTEIGKKEAALMRMIEKALSVWDVRRR